MRNCTLWAKNPTKQQPYCNGEVWLIKGDDPADDYEVCRECGGRWTLDGKS